MKKFFFLFFIFAGFSLFFYFFPAKILAQTRPTPVPIQVMVTPTPELCEGGCPANTECGPQDIWVRDDEVTALGKGGERSRQFVYWVLTHPSIDNHPTILWIWGLSRNIVYFLLLITAILMGLGIVISQRSNFNLKIEISPLLIKLFLLLLYTTFSATIVLLIIQVSDIMMQFFIKRMGGDQLFNIFFQGTNSEVSYKTFEGCRNSNPNNIEMVRTSMFLIRFTNMTYYLIGIMLILRKIILWFLLIVSPFLAILMPYVFIRNIGWIWIGVFFQWVFYGPLFGLFLGGLAKIWNSKDHIPFIFDFSRRNKLEEIVYPTSINILYGGPAQKLEILNSSNYVDTFAEYIISLIMLWTAIFLPWWLLRIFRDYCCEGIMASKNILMAMYDSLKSGGFPPGPPPPSPTLTPTRTGMARKLPEEHKVVSRIKLETVEDIKRARTEEIKKVMQISVRRLTDIAHFETNKKTQETVRRNLEYLQNPMKAQTPTERQKFMNLRSELFNRALKGDVVAKQTLASISSSRFEQKLQQEKIVKTIPQMAPVIKTTSVKVGLPTDKTTSVVRSIFNSIANNNDVVNNISSQANVTNQQTQSILSAITSEENLNQPVQTVINNVARQTGIDKEKIKEVIEKTTSFFKQREVISQTATKEQVSEDQVDNVVENIFETVSQAPKEEGLVKVVSLKVGLPEEKSTSVISSLFKTVSQRTDIVNTISSHVNVTSQQTRSILKTISSVENLNQPIQSIVEVVSQKTGIDREMIKAVVAKSLSLFITQKELIKQVADKEGVKEQLVRKIVDSHLPVIAEPEKHIEDSVTIPPTVSIEDYEEVKNMWVDQYEKGEVPISENIKDRKQWLETDIITITNILNKILSNDPKLKAEGLSDLAYILPLFMINNLKGEELLVYLKAKLEAAKQVKREMEKQEEVKEKMKEKEEEVLVERPKEAKKEKEKEMTMEEELKPEKPKVKPQPNQDNQPAEPVSDDK